MRILDLYCCQGGAGEGYRRAGFEVVGVDLEPQPLNPHPFVQMNALTALRTLLNGGTVGGYTLREFDAIHASPPCQAHSVLQRRTGKEYPRLIEPTRDLLEQTGLPYVIENVVGAPLLEPVKLCGSMFDLPVERHRLFETNWYLHPMPCCHQRQRDLWPEGFPALRSGREGQRARVVGVFGTGGGDAKDVNRWRWAMGIDWMDKAGLAQSIPPAYTEYIGRQLAEDILVGMAERAMAA